MKIEAPRLAHIGPPPSRTGGPAGYLQQLSLAFQGRPGSDRVTFPAPAPHPAPRPQRGVLSRFEAIGRMAARRLKRAAFGPPSFYRPSLEDMRIARGPVHKVMEGVASGVVEVAAASLSAAVHDGETSVLFTHDSFVAEAALTARRPTQQVWLFVHAPFPAALYHAWCFGLPEADWRDVLAFPDVRCFGDRELDVLKRVDRILLPCPEAADELARVDARFGEVLKRASFTLTGGASPRRERNLDPDRAASRRRLGLPGNERNERIGLFLGNTQPYRGFDLLSVALARLPKRQTLPGLVAVAGPDPDSLPRHPRLLPLGRVSDVAGLLDAVDFVVNVNRFSLFDLSLIEAAEAGKPLLLSAVGGNRAFQRLGAGCVLLGELSEASVAKGLEALFRMPASELAELGRSSRTAWESALTPRHLYERHMALMDVATWGVDLVA